MAEIVNLRQARKAKARVQKNKDASANRAAFGRTKTEKRGAEAEQARAERTLDAHKRDAPEKP